MVDEKKLAIFDIQDEKKRMAKTKMEQIFVKRKTREICYVNDCHRNTKVHISYDFKKIVFLNN